VSRNVLDMQMIVIPINHHNTHWALAVLWPHSKEICYMDSLGGASASYVTSTLLRWFADEVEDKRGEVLTMTDWSVRPPPDNLPQQHNGCDCGVFLCMYANYVSLGLEDYMNFQQCYMDELRVFLAHAIMSKALPLPLGL
jgi:sentrin-specific protease 1